MRPEGCVAAPGKIVDTTLGGIVACNGGDGHDSIDRGHVDDGTTSAGRHFILLNHLSGCSLPRLTPATQKLIRDMTELRGL